MSITDGGPAFPVPHSIDGNWVSEPRDKYSGMSLRDYFAAHSLAGLLVRNWTDMATGKVPDNVQELWAAGAYAVADAMLKERNK